MNQFKGLAMGLLAFLALYAANDAAYVVTEGRQAVVTEFGRPISSGESAAGLYFKLPFIQDVQFVDKRILTWDGWPNQIPTRDKKYILVDTTARWLIVDALKFIQTVQTERGAKARLDAILDAVTRDTISGHNLVEAVRNTNQILDYIDQKRVETQRQLATGAILVAEEEEVTGEIEKIQVGREHLSTLIAKRAAKELEPFGINIIDVQLRRISYEGSVEKKVYERMISERKRIAEKIRSIGKGEKAKIQGKTSRDLQQIQSEAYYKAQLLKGAADAKAITIYAAAYSKDPSFYTFTKKMDAYRTGLKADTRLLMSTDTPFLNLFKKAP